MTRPSSGRWYWCLGCGKWHDPLLLREMHYSMYFPMQEPNEKNFEGTAEDRARFAAWQALQDEDAEAMERRVDQAVAQESA